jgi:iron complex outermembrane receptor protein
LTLADGTVYAIPAMTTYNASMHYKFKIGDYNARLRLLVKNLSDERAPTADRFFGYFADAHQDLGRNYQLDLRLRF